MGWTVEQQNAIDKRNSNILVAASAGSGKTAVLVERIIKRIIEENVDIDRLLIVTFTRAAAKEMKERIENKIREKLKENPRDKHLLRQRKNIKNAYITTIDSFFYKIVQNNFYELDGVDPNISIAESKDVFQYKDRAFNELLEEEYEKEDNILFDRLFNVICDSSEDKFKELLFQIHSFSQGFPYPKDFLEEAAEEYNMDKIGDLYETTFGKNLYKKIEEDIEIAIANLENAIDLVALDEQLEEKYTDRFTEDIKRLKLCIDKENPSINKLYNNITSDIFGRMPTIKGVENIELKNSVTAIRKNASDKIKKIKEKLYDTPDVMKQDLQTAYEDAKYIKDLVLSLDEKFMKLKIKSNRLEFNDIAHLALNMLVKKAKDESGNVIYTETNVAKKYKERFDEIYIDEYQDSNYIQEIVLRSVSKVDQGKPNQFMVGDIKQSIYKFRNAVPEIFAEKYDNYSEDDNADMTKIVLAKNFRSRKEVLEGINYIFEQVMSKEAGECSYQGKECLSLGAEYEYIKEQDYSLELNVVEAKEDDEKEEYVIQDEVIEELIELENIELEAEVIAEKIKSMINSENPYKVYDLKKREFRNIKYKDIVILLRSAQGKDKKIEEVLKSHGIPTFTDKSEGLLNAEEVKFVLTFLELLDNWYQDIPLVSMMYSIVGKFTLDEIIRIRKYHPQGYLFDALLFAKQIEDETIKQKIENFLSMLEKFTYYSKYYGISELIWKIYNETNIYEQFLLKENGPQKCANLDNLLNLAVGFEKVDYKGLYHFIEYVNQIKDSDTSKEAKIIGENEDVVRIITIHKSKGLEYPVVFLASSNDDYIKKMNKPLVTKHMKYGFGLDVIEDYEGISTIHNSLIKNVIDIEEEKETISEELRCLYVALTRAKEKMIVVGSIKSNSTLEKTLEKLLVVRQKDGNIKPNFVLEAKSSMKVMLLAMKEDLGTPRCKVGFNYIIKEKSKLKKISQEQHIDYFKTFEDYTNNLESKDISKYKQILEYKYPNISATNTMQKYSVSEIKKMDTEKEEILDNLILNESIDISIKIPKFMRKKEETKYSSAQKGTLIHLVLNYLDFKNVKTLEDILLLINTLKEKGIITKEEIKYISPRKILNLINSDLGNKIRKAIKIEKEKPFVYKINPTINELLKDKLKVDDNILIQGIIDMYFIDEEDNITLIDYKTDKIEKEEELVEKYKIQLELYKDALENISNKKVKEVYIYSIYLDKQIKI